MVTFSITVTVYTCSPAIRALNFSVLTPLAICSSEPGNLNSLFLDNEMLPTNDSIALSPLVPIHLQNPSSLMLIV